MTDLQLCRYDITFCGLCPYTVISIADNIFRAISELKFCALLNEIFITSSMSCRMDGISS